MKKAQTASMTLCEINIITLSTGRDGRLWRGFVFLPGEDCVENEEILKM